jgi:2-oxoglutarate ferredoxin oxidoreductase subunit gamma
MTQRQELRLTGSGGQGMILAAIILAEAAGYDGNQVVQTQSYGPEARGGASKAEVVIDGESIDYPKVTLPDAVLAMSDEAYRKYGNTLKENGLLLVDSTYVKNISELAGNTVSIPITRIAKEKLGTPQVANIVALGAINRIMKAVSDDALREAVKKRCPRGTEELNLKALDYGYMLAENAIMMTHN